jgi:hypothetical protein
MIRRLRSLWRRLRRRWPHRILEHERALCRAQLDLALRQGTDPASLSIRVGGREDDACHKPE